MNPSKVTNLQSYKSYKEAKESGKPIPVKEAAKHDTNVAFVLEQITRGEIYPCEPGYDQPWSQEMEYSLDRALEKAFPSSTIPKAAVSEQEKRHWTAEKEEKLDNFLDEQYENKD